MSNPTIVPSSGLWAAVIPAAGSAAKPHVYPVVAYRVHGGYATPVLGSNTALVRGGTVAYGNPLDSQDVNVLVTDSHETAQLLIANSQEDGL